MRSEHSPTAGCDPRLISSFHSLSEAASVVAILVGSFVLLGWILDVGTLKSVSPGLVTMKANSALAFILAGVSLWLWRREEPGLRARRIAQGAAVLVALLGLLTLGEYLLGRDLGIDQLLFEEARGAVATQAPGQMAPHSALNFFLLGSALLLLDAKTRRGHRPGEFLAVIVGGTSGVVLVGYLYGVESLGRLAPYTQMALHTALVFVVIALGLLAARPGRGLMAVVASDGPGGVMARRLLPLAIALPPLLGWLRIEAQRAGLHRAEFGMSLVVVSIVIVFTILIWWTARLVDRAERERRGAERAAGRERQQAVVAELGRRALASADISTLMNEATDLVAQNLGLEYCKVLELLPDGRALRLRAGVGWKEGYVGNATVGAGADSQAGYTLLSDEPVVVEDLRTETRFSGPPLLLDHRVVSGISAVIRGGERPFGVLGAHTTRRRAFTEDDVHFLGAIANILAAAIRHDRLLTETERRRQAAEALADLGRVISQSLEPGEVARRITESVLALLGANTSILFRLDPATGDLVSLAVSEAVAPYFGRNVVFPHGSGAVGLTVRERRPVVSLNVLTDERITFTREMRTILEQAPYRAVLAVPIFVKGEIIGALGVGDRLGRVFGDDEIRVAQAFADQASVALENSRLYAELRAALEELEASQDRIVGAERLRALGQLAGGVAHDFNNTLAIILGRTELLIAQVRSPNVRQQLQVIQKTALDAARTVKRIEEFTRMKAVRPVKLVRLDRVVEEVVEISRCRWQDEAQAKGIPYDVVLETAVGLLPPVVGDPSELREALLNVLFNALDAMPAGGRVTFRTDVEEGRVVCAVTDTGIGMTEEVRQRIFDPFFTTKGDRGSGLGLSVVYGIITRHGGEMDVQSEVERGTTFTIRLPAARLIRETRKEEAPPRLRGRAKVLVVEDELEVREVLRDMLASQGHDVVVCPNGEAGLRRFQEEPFDLVITDLGMRGVTGWEVVEGVKGRTPETPVILVTGWGDRIDSQEARARGVDFLVSKPFKGEDLETVLAHALGKKTLPTRG